MAPFLVGVLSFVLALSIPKKKLGRIAAWLLLGMAVASFWLAVDQLYSPW